MPITTRSTRSDTPLFEQIFKEATKLARYNTGKKVTTRDILTAASKLYGFTVARKIALAASSTASRVSNAEYTAHDVFIGLMVVLKPDFTEMPKSTEQKLAEALAENERLKKQLARYSKESRYLGIDFSS